MGNVQQRKKAARALPKIGTGAQVYGDAKHRTREAAVEAAIYEIDNGLERSRRKPFD